MNFKLNIIIVLLFINSCNSSPKNVTSIKSNDSASSINSKFDNFRLRYTYVGLGCNFGSMYPTFRVRGNNYVCSLEQNSTYNTKYDKKPKFICNGKLRVSSLDSIINIVKNINDTIVYQTNNSSMTGVTHYISVKFENKHINFHLHNGWDSSAQKIVNILNSNLPSNKRKLWLFDNKNEK